MPDLESVTAEWRFSVHLAFASAMDFALVSRTFEQTLSDGSIRKAARKIWTVGFPPAYAFETGDTLYFPKLPHGTWAQQRKTLQSIVHVERHNDREVVFSLTHMPAGTEDWYRMTQMQFVEFLKTGEVPPSAAARPAKGTPLTSPQGLAAPIPRAMPAQLVGRTMTFTYMSITGPSQWNAVILGPRMSAQGHPIFDARSVDEPKKRTFRTQRILEVIDQDGEVLGWHGYLSKNFGPPPAEDLAGHTAHDEALRHYSTVYANGL